MSSSCSFRITRTAEDLAQTINALSQRLLRLEQSQEAIELQLNQSSQEQPIEELEMLDSIDQVLKECQERLETSSKIGEEFETDWSEEHNQDEMVA